MGRVPSRVGRQESSGTPGAGPAAPWSALESGEWEAASAALRGLKLPGSRPVLREGASPGRRPGSKLSGLREMLRAFEKPPDLRRGSQAENSKRVDYGEPILP